MERENMIPGRMFTPGERVPSEDLFLDEVPKDLHPNKAPAAIEEAPSGELYVEFKAPYTFEGAEYTGIDLSGLAKLKIKDAVEIQKQLAIKNEEATQILIETSSAFARALAAKATGKPIEFFELANSRTVMKPIQRTIQKYLNAEVPSKGHVMTFETPYQFKGEVYTEADLTGIGELNSLQESAIENKMARAGVYAAENSVNYYYACLEASFGTGLSEEFFTGLPLRELIKLKAMVNSSDFLG